MIRLSLSFFFMFVVLAGLSLSASGREIYLVCSLIGPENTRYQYSFSFDTEKSTLFWIEGSQKLKVIRNTSTQLWASHKMKFRDFPHDETDFRLNRVTGAAEISYLRKPSPADIAGCMRERNWGCEDLIVLTEKSESGTCKVIDRVVK
jgi:hypothetical protein